MPSTLPPIRADGRALKQALLHVLSNAVKYSPDGGSVTVDGRHTEAGSVEIRVSDRGGGIEPANLPRFLRPFQDASAALSNENGGIGPGLPINAKLMEAMGGTLAVESLPGRGATVILSFPASRLALD